MFAFTDQYSEVMQLHVFELTCVVQVIGFALSVDTLTGMTLHSGHDVSCCSDTQFISSQTLRHTSLLAKQHVTICNNIK